MDHIVSPAQSATNTASTATQPPASATAFTPTRWALLATLVAAAAGAALIKVPSPRSTPDDTPAATSGQAPALQQVADLHPAAPPAPALTGLSPMLSRVPTAPPKSVAQGASAAASASPAGEPEVFVMASSIDPARVPKLPPDSIPLVMTPSLSLERLGLQRPLPVHNKPMRFLQAVPTADAQRVAHAGGPAAPVSTSLAPASKPATPALTKHEVPTAPTALGPKTSAVARAANAYQEAQDWVRSGRSDAALSSAQEALALDPNLNGARYLAITVALERKQLDVAGGLIDAGLQLDAQDSYLAYLQARYLLARGQGDQALRLLQTRERLPAEAWGLKAGLLVRNGLHEQAVAAYEQALRSRPTNSTWWLGLGLALDAQGNKSTAREAFNRASTLGTLRADLQAWVEQRLASAN